MRSKHTRIALTLSALVLSLSFNTRAKADDMYVTFNGANLTSSRHEQKAQ